MKRLLPVITAWCFSAGGGAVDSIGIDIDRLAGAGWTLNGIQFSYEGLVSSRQSLILRIKTMALPAPFDDFNVLDLECPSARLGRNAVVCERGTAYVKSSRLDRSRINLSFRISPSAATLRLFGIAIFGGRADLDVFLESDDWRIDYRAKDLAAGRLGGLSKTPALQSLSGLVDASGVVYGRRAEVGEARVRFSATHATFQNDQGTIAGEDVSLAGTFEARRTDGRHVEIDMTLALREGALYADPILVEAPLEPLELTGRLSWDFGAQRLTVDELIYAHPGLGELRARGVVDAAGPQPFRDLDLALHSSRIGQLYSTYVAPYFAATDFEGMALAGEVTSKASIEGGVVSAFSARFSGLSVQDRLARVDLRGGKGNIEWFRNRSADISSVSWESAKVYAIPVGAGQLRLQTAPGTVRLVESLDVPVLDGSVHIGTLAVSPAGKGGNPDIRFDGRIVGVSLEKLTQALDWTPMAGNISGVIPGVSLRSGRVSLDGRLTIQVFDGEIVIQSLSVTDLFDDLPILSADLDIDNLDLNALTDKFAFGNIDGRLDGEIRGLYLENWRPLAFDARFATPPGDDSRRRISQKAVESITSIGGGGTANLLSRTVLRLFDSFGYRRLGIACRLRGGVCELSGLESANGGYYIVKGGGLPRIDVIGYNRRVDWNVLLQRLQRIAASDSAVVQ